MCLRMTASTNSDLPTSKWWNAWNGSIFGWWKYGRNLWDISLKWADFGGASAVSLIRTGWEFGLSIGLSKRISFSLGLVWLNSLSIHVLWLSFVTHVAGMANLQAIKLNMNPIKRIGKDSFSTLYRLHTLSFLGKLLHQDGDYFVPYRYHPIQSMHVKAEKLQLSSIHCYTCSKWGLS